MLAPSLDFYGARRPKVNSGPTLEWLRKYWEAIKGAFVLDFFSKKSFFSSKKSVFICFNNFFKIIRLSKKFIFSFFVEAEKSSF